MEDANKMLQLASQLSKLPPRRPKGHPDNLLRAVAAGFIFMGYNTEDALKRAKDMIEFYNWMIGGPNDQG